jgi:PPOX class probable F420-dependent enzyme
MEDEEIDQRTKERRREVPGAQNGEPGSAESPEYERLASEKYVLLTTYRRTGEPVATPIGVAGADGDLVVWTDRASGKVKRILRNPAVEIQACDMRSRTTHGAVVRGKARILDGAGSDRVRLVLARKYGLVGRGGHVP